MPVIDEHTLAIDIGGTGLKATVLNAAGKPVHERVRIPTTFPCPPDKLVADLAGLVAPLPAYQRVSVGFPGVVRGGKVRTAPAFVTIGGLGTTVKDSLVEAWTGFDLAAALQERLGKPTRVANDADVQGAGAVTGRGIELVVTLGTGVGTAVFDHGRLALHLELAHHPLKGDKTYNEVLGDAARKKVGAKRWNKRVAKAVAVLDALIVPDSILIGGGNAQRITVDLGPKVTLVDNDDGLLGGIKLWDGDGIE